MPTHDPHRFSNQLDAPASKRLIERLENRAREAIFTTLFDQYIAKLNFPLRSKTLEIGCGTGAMSRALVKKDSFHGSVVAVDQSEAFIKAAKQFAQIENVSESIEFGVGDVHALDFEDSSFDVVIAHTILSHVTNPTQVLKEVARVIKKGGRLVVFDGDYGSLTYAYHNHQFGKKMDHALALATFNNPLVMRDLLSMLPVSKFKMIETLGNVVYETKSSSYFKSFADTYTPMVIASELIPQTEVEKWSKAQEEAMDNGFFFASCNYYTYICQRI